MLIIHDVMAWRQVLLMEPSLPKQQHDKQDVKPPVHVNKQHNIEWNFTLKANTNRELMLR